MSSVDHSGSAEPAVGEQRQGAPEVLGGVRVRVDVAATFASTPERLGRPFTQVVCREADGVRELERTAVVMGDEFDDVVVARVRLDPLGDLPMLRRACRAGDAGVGDVADQGVLEGVLGFLGDDRARIEHDQVTPVELVQLARAPGRIEPTGRDQRTRPEDLADDGRVLEQRLRLRRKSVQTRGDHLLNGVGHGQPPGLPIGDRARILLGKERVARDPQYNGFQLVGQRLELEQTAQQGAGLLVGER